MGGGDHPRFVDRGDDGGQTGCLAGRFSEAISLFETTLTDRERVLGLGHPGTLTTRNNLAYDYESAGRAAEALALFEQNLTEAEQ
ncbi:tetratricopeptide repeat protein [Nocardia sienata]|uniref:tetratricopeptide repeat protein n=1 Tax=Nocardia sienata TaxID=248552 RepID=UPI0007A3D220|nr:tetratricopeptide repeat protein [Nocardia sienata]